MEGPDCPALRELCYGAPAAGRQTFLENEQIYLCYEDKNVRRFMNKDKSV